MATDLFGGSLNGTSFGDIENFLAVASPIETRPVESAVLDYKSDDAGEWVETIAAFANTAGGLLFLGVESDRSRNNAPVAIPGVLFSGGDIKARLTAKIVSQVVPRPEFDVASAALPNDPDRFVALVRVREGIYPPYQYSKERDKVRFPIRVQDTTRSATLRDIEFLFSKRGAFGETAEQRVQEFFAAPLFPRVLTNYSDADESETSPRPYHVLSVRPRTPVRFRLDRSFDEYARGLVERVFPDTKLGEFWPPIMTGQTHLLRWQSGVGSESSPMARWARYFEWTASGEVRIAERIDRREWKNGESVSDIFVSVLRGLRLIAEFYSGQNSFGSLSVLHTLQLQPEFKLLLTFPGKDQIYRETDAIRFSQVPVKIASNISNMVTEIESFSQADKVEIVCDFMLGHLRLLRQATIDYDSLRRVVSECPIEKTLIYFP